MSTLDDAAEAPGAARTPGDLPSAEQPESKQPAGEQPAGTPSSAAATPVSESVYEGADKIVPSTVPTVVKIEGHTDEVDPLARGNRLRKESWGLVVRRVWADFFHDALMDRAATMTYFTLMAFAPTVLAAYSIATLIFSSRLSLIHI